MLETFSKNRKERISEHKDEMDHDAHRDKFKKKQITKNIGKSEKVHRKNKPVMMMKKKKLAMAHEKFDRKLN
jgi:hypothetical protein